MEKEDYINRDTELVNRVVNENSSEAINELIYLYTPMIKKLASLYYIRGFNQADWMQEAYIVCHETCFRYKGKRGSKFGSFFKLRLKNHYLSLIRHELALKRKVDHDAMSFEGVKAQDDGVQLVGARQGVITTEVTVDLNDFCKSLSKLEAKVFLMLLGIMTFEEVCQKTQATKEQVYSAKNRCRQKFIDYIN